jgi:hypothetical protein
MTSKMRRLIRHKVTLSFFKEGEWTNDPGLAQQFVSLASAYQTKCHFKLKGVELYFAFGCSRLPSNYDFSMALEDLRSGCNKAAGVMSMWGKPTPGDFPDCGG